MSFIDFTRIYKLIISNVNLNIAKKWKLTYIKNYFQYINLNKIDLDYLYN